MATMDYNKFIGLSGLELCQYMEPLAVDSGTVVLASDLRRMLSELGTYDEYHLTYALTLGAQHSPDIFSMQLPQYLPHSEGSVWSTALNSLDRLPSKFVTQELVELVRQVQSQNPSKEWIRDSLGRLEARLGGADSS